MARTLCWISCLVAAVAPVATARASEVVELHHNPFQRPELSATSPGHRVGATAAQSGEGLELRATLTGPGDAMANVNGVILTVGETVDGFRLLQVDERQAVLERDGTRVVVSLEDTE